MMNFFTDLTKYLEQFADALEEKYDGVKDNIKKYDLTTDEGYEKFINEAAELRKQLQTYDTYFSDRVVEFLDSMVASASRKHEEAKDIERKKEEAKAAVEAEKARLIKDEVNRTNSENYNKNNSTITDFADTFKKTEIDWPSSHISVKQRRQIWELVDEYMDEKVLPYLTGVDAQKIDSVASGLFEFAAWILKHEK